MRTGCWSGNEREACPRGLGCGLDLFVNERGYTTVAVAVALLVSIALVFGVATAEGVLSHAADVQEVADAAALAGSRSVSAYVTIAQVTDACVLSLGLAGMTVMGAALVMAAIPGAGDLSGRALKAGHDILDARNRFARSAADGLQVLEGALPGMVVVNSWECVQANNENNGGYRGAALPIPLESQSDFSSMEGEVDAQGLDKTARRLQDAAEEVREAKERADAALLRAWTADCVDSPRCMRSRAADLAGLSPAQNPYVGDARSWTFGVAIQRSRAYYAQRLARERPAANDIESVADSLARKAFYEYALEEVRAAWYTEHPDGTVSLSIPHLARSADEMRATHLYTDALWPCTQETQGRTLHAALSCPGAVGVPDGADCVASVDAGLTRRCEVCGFDVGDLGAVASISTIASNGYEHYWQVVVEEAQAYQRARNEQMDAERRTKEVAKEGSGVFEAVLSQLKTPRPRICPPGAWGCVGVVACEGAAVSASALAPDNATRRNTALVRLLNKVAGGGDSLAGSLLGGVAAMWGDLLVSYGAAYEGVGTATGSFLDKVDGVFGGTAGAWLKERVAGAMGSLGLEPSDLRVRKPVLVSAQDVLGRAGMNVDGKVSELVRLLLASTSAHDFAGRVGVWVWDEVRRRFSIAELPIPGTSTSIPLSVDLSCWGTGQ